MRQGQRRRELPTSNTEGPKKIKPTRLGDYLEVMSKAIFQAGMSWKVVENKWPGIQDTFHGFDAASVAGFSDRDIDTLAGDKRVIRNRRKLEAISGNARQMLELEAEHGSFAAYLRSHADFEATVKDLRKRFKFLGDTGAYFFLYVVGEEVPDHAMWSRSRGIDPETMRPA